MLAAISWVAFMPHGSCYLWDENVIWLHGLSDAFTALAYFSIPISLIRFVRARSDVAYPSIYFWFALFIVSCGLTHALEVVAIWWPIYYFQGTVKALTAISSLATAFLLIRWLPFLKRLPAPKELQRANAELQMANKELEAFSYSVSHDLRAPLRAIDGFSKILAKRNPDLDSDSKRLLGMLRSETDRMAHLIEDLLAFSRILRKPMNLREVDMEWLAKEAFSTAAALEPERQIEFHIEPLPKVLGEEGMLRQVWANLLSNSVKFTRRSPHPVISISGREEKGEMIFSVTDNGEGFDMAYADKLFGVFQRLHTDQEFEGTGVGLALAQRILHRHGGRIWAQAKLHEGATFSFALPVQENAA